jgi:hypothetical protein
MSDDPRWQDSPPPTKSYNAPYQNLFDFVGPGSVYGTTPGQPGSGWIPDPNNPAGSVESGNQGGMTYKFAPEYGNISQYITPQQGAKNVGEGSQDYADSYNIDYSKLPKPKYFNDISQLMSIAGDKNTDPRKQESTKKWFKDPSKIYWDDNYGWITHSTNFNEKGETGVTGFINNTVMPLTQAAAMSLFGGVTGLAGSLGGQVVQGLGGLGNMYSNGGGFNPMGLANIASGFVPGGVGQGLRLGLSAYNAADSFNKGNYGSGLGSLYQFGKGLQITGGG